MVGRIISFWKGIFLGAKAMLILWKVKMIVFLSVFSSKSPRFRPSNEYEQQLLITMMT